MNEKKYMELVKRVNELESKVKTQDELIDLLTDQLIFVNGKISALEDIVLSR